MIRILSALFLLSACLATLPAKSAVCNGEQCGSGGSHASAATSGKK